MLCTDTLKQLHRILLTFIPRSTNLVAFQALLKTEVKPELSEAFSSACTRCLEVLAATYLDWEAALLVIADSLTDIANILNLNGHVSSFYDFTLREDSTH